MDAHGHAEFGKTESYPIPLQDARLADFEAVLRYIYFGCVSSIFVLLKNTDAHFTIA